MKKRLVVTGCSFAAHYAKTIGLEQFPIWPELLAKDLNLRLTNKAQMGASNREIYSKTLDAIVQFKDIDFVVVMWSEWDRISFNHESPWRSFSPETTYAVQVENFPGCLEICETMDKYKLQNLQGIVNETIRLIWSLQTILESMNINYVFIQGPEPNPYQRYDIHMYGQQILKSPHVHLINDRFVGWPPNRMLAGWNIDHFFRHHQEKEFDHYTIGGDEDAHPNALGNELIFYALREHYENYIQN
tara:strand:+ start:8410 stop:9144 length:735 start_codon:yes stop_codon:yes gene_type:complete